MTLTTVCTPKGGTAFHFTTACSFCCNATVCEPILYSFWHATIYFLLISGLQDCNRTPQCSVVQALVFLLALAVRAANKPPEYDSDDEYIAPTSSVRQPLINNRQGVTATGVPVTGTLDQRPSRNDAWSQRMREKVRLLYTVKNFQTLHSLVVACFWV